MLKVKYLTKVVSGPDLAQDLVCQPQFRTFTLNVIYCYHWIKIYRPVSFFCICCICCFWLFSTFFQISYFSVIPFCLHYSFIYLCLLNIFSGCLRIYNIHLELIIIYLQMLLCHFTCNVRILQQCISNFGLHSLCYYCHTFYFYIILF